jgi:hypothetical protein
LKVRRLGMPLWRLLGGFDPVVPCYAGGINIILTLTALMTQTAHDNGLPGGARTRLNPAAVRRSRR